MRYVLKKLYKTNRHGDELGATITVEHPNGQMRMLRGKVGGPHVNGNYVFELHGDGTIVVTADSDVHFSISPAE
jgi:hypothetical protein